MIGTPRRYLQTLEVITRAANGKLPPQIVAEQGRARHSEHFGTMLKHICYSPSKLPTCPGWDAFRKLEADCFQSAASVAAARKAWQKPKVLILPLLFLPFAVVTSLVVASLQGKILACGGGIIETAPAMDIMRCHNPASWSC